MFKRVSGARSWLLGIGGFIGIIAGWIGYADLAKAFLPERFRMYVPLLMIAGFACALWAVGTTEDKVDPEPSIVIHQRTVSDYDEERGEWIELHHLTLRNVGYHTLTKIRMDPIELLGVHVRLSDGIESLAPGEEKKVQIWALGILAKHVGRLLPKHEKGETPAVARLKMTIRCRDWQEKEQYVLEYVLAMGRNTSIFDIRRAHPGDDIAWTDVEAMASAVKTERS